MKRFRFRLQKLEWLREIVRQEAEGALARSRDALNELRTRREKLTRQLENSQDRFGASIQGAGADGSTVRTHAEDLQALRGALDAARPQEQSAQAEAEAAELDLIEKARDHRAMERLRQKQRQGWLEEGLLAEQRFLDELHLMTRNPGQMRKDDNA